MARVDKYRAYAAECVRLAQIATDLNHKAKLLKMAEYWRDLVEKAEREERDR